MSAEAETPDQLSGLLSATAVPALDVLFRELVPELLRYFASRLDNREDAADAVADTLLILWRKARVIPDSHEDARRYAYGVARRVLSTARRSAMRRNALADRLRTLTREEPTNRYEPDLELRSALATLPEKDRELVLLVAWDGFTVADAGCIIGIKPDTARARYSRARAKLRQQLS